jgi:hypothetical protein
MNKPDMQRLVSLFGSAAEIAWITGVTTSAVSRWSRYKIPEKYLSPLVEAALDKDLDPYEVAYAVGVPRCPVCGSYHINGHTLLNHHKRTPS